MHSEVYLTIKYRIEDRAGELTSESLLYDILNELELHRNISNVAQAFLQEKGFLALLKYAQHGVSFADFVKIAELEQSARRMAIKEEAARKKREDEALLTKQKLDEKAFFAKLKSDPRNRAKERQFKLREQYGLTRYIEQDDFVKLMDILRRADKGERLADEEVVWLATKRYDSDGYSYESYFTDELRKKYHENEAKFYHGEFEKNKDPWFAVNASGHYRKCEEARIAELILKKIDIPCLKDRKLKSALCTTHGGVKRDLARFDEALSLGKQAHEHTPQDFRPCTLLGAVYIETGQFDLGHSWYQKAVERGYSKDSVDSDLKSIFHRIEKSQQKAMRDDLLRRDPERYKWAKSNRASDSAEAMEDFFRHRS